VSQVGQLMIVGVFKFCASFNFMGIANVCAEACCFIAVPYLSILVISYQLQHENMMRTYLAAVGWWTQAS
jgi:hypothetical protein